MEKKHGTLTVLPLSWKRPHTIHIMILTSAMISYLDISLLLRLTKRRGRGEFNSGDGPDRSLDL